MIANRVVRLRSVVTLLAAVTLAIAGCTSQAAAPKSTSDTLASSPPTTSVEPTSNVVESSATPTSEMPTGPITGEAPNGDYIVGIDIAPGIWQCRSVGDDLYWETSDRAGRIISNDLGAIARVAAEAFAVKLAGCQDDWIAVDAEPASNEAVEVTSSGSGSPARDADIALCQNAFERFSDDLRADLDEAILAGHLSPVNLWFAASTFGSVTVGDASGTVARSIGDFNGAALRLTQEGVVEMSDEGAQIFMQSYYDMRTACENIKAWG